MRRRVPPLNALRTFEAVARNGSFTRAAEELFVTEPAVSRAVKVLEDHFQTQLFERQPRGLALTAEAKVLLPTVQASLDAIADVSRELYRASERPSLRLLVTPHVCAHWLGKRRSRYGLDGVNRALGDHGFSVNGKSDNGTAPSAVICTSCSSFTP